MNVREAMEADAERMADVAETPPDVMRNLVHDRTVRVATDVNSSDESGTILGLVSYDALRGTVHVTQFAGTRAACTRLLEEPIRFATNERMSVELLVSDSDETIHDVVETVGFENVETGPQFDGEPTTRYRLDPTATEQ